MKRAMWVTFGLGLWLMISPFFLIVVNHAIFNTLWEDLLLGFGIATFSLCRLLARRENEIALADWFVTALGFLTMINPIIYRYFNLKFATWNNVAFGAIILIVAIFQDYKDSAPAHYQAAR